MADQKAAQSLESKGFLDEQKSPMIIRGIALILLAMLVWSEMKKGKIGLKGGDGAFSADQVCLGSENVVFAAGEEKKAGVMIGSGGCLSGAVDIRGLYRGNARSIRFSYDFPAGRKEIYECDELNTKRCHFYAAITGEERGVVNFPHVFRVKGPTGMAYFSTQTGHASDTSFRPKLTPESEKRIAEIEQAVREIKELQKRNKGRKA
jgi:hypothetical protein